ncbi:MAG: DUF922 domain-containing protein [Candidatus Bipolaricaulota bacterium]|nr:DUF922 domain-containing protein [Candidatus Bipolaricaulota bacterium]
MQTALCKRAAFMLVVLVTIAFLLTVGAIAQVSEHVPWSAEQQVTWKLFLAPYPQDGCMQAEAAAIHMTLNWSVSYVIDYERSKGTWYGYVDKSMINVTNTMEPLLSWAASDGKSVDVLHHEQRHFDLNEVYARKLVGRLALPHATGTGKDEVRTALRKEINATASAVLDMASQMQSLYDDETEHGTNAETQTNWAAKIDAWLASPMQAP